MIGRLLRTLAWWTQPVDASIQASTGASAPDPGGVGDRMDASTKASTQASTSAVGTPAGRDRVMWLRYAQSPHPLLGCTTNDLMDAAGVDYPTAERFLLDRAGETIGQQLAGFDQALAGDPVIAARRTLAATPIAGADRPEHEALAALLAATLPVAASVYGRQPRHDHDRQGACLPGCLACALATLLAELGTDDPACTLLTTRPAASTRAVVA